MREILNSSLVFAGPTSTPQGDLAHGPSERHFRAVLAEVSPDVIHIEELVGLPSSIIDIARAAGIPVVATLQDYTPLCPTTKLFDIDGQLCLRRDVGQQCVRCCSAPGAGPNFLRRLTLSYELQRCLPPSVAQRGLDAITRARRLASRLVARTRRTPRSAADVPDGEPTLAQRGRAPAAYQARRDINVQRLGRMDLLIAQSQRVREIYAQLGVPEDRLRVMQLTLEHLSRMRPRTIEAPPPRIHFATLNACVAPSKGSEVILDALRRLYEGGLGDRFRLTVWGGASSATQRRLASFPGVRYEGGYDIGDLDELLSDVDVGIIPSVWEEAYGYVGVEFLAKGIPIIGNRRGGIVDYTREGETGWVNAEATGQGLAAIMSRLIDDPQQVVEINRRVVSARSRLIRTMPEHAAEVRSVYRELIALRV
jgi:glycosyltransferase involved in cell wall biosynthesis